MASGAGEPVLIVSPRYADDVAAAVTASGLIARVERRPDRAATRFLSEPGRLAVVDARGALAQGLVAARALGDAIEVRRGAMLVLLSKGDTAATRAAHDAGATAVLVSPFNLETFVNSMRLTARHAKRLADVAAGRLINVDGTAPPRHDELTGLATGDQLQQWTEMLLGVPGQGRRVFLLALGVGRFAPVNAAYGREVADRLLQAVASRLTQTVDARQPGQAAAETRLLARLAAAEFGIGIAGPVHLADAMRLANALVEAFERPFAVDSHVIHLSVRIGIAGAPGTDDPELGGGAAMIRQASAALAAAREGDGGGIQVFEPSPDGDPLTRLANLESDLHRAIDGGGVAVLFQPLLHIKSGRISSVEALVRWDHPELGLLSAETLLETAASAELAVRLGNHIRRRAIAIAANWDGPLAGLRLSLNVTAADLADPGFVTSLDSALGDGGLDRTLLTLEVTEGALIDDMQGAMRTLDSLRATGVRIALDDFGTGYSSLAWMARLPIDAVKLDRSFVLGLIGSERERMVVETVVALSKRLGLEVTAEGVEDDAQLTAARVAGCDKVQGFRISAPLAIDALIRFCDDWTQQADGVARVDAGLAVAGQGSAGQ